MCHYKVMCQIGDEETTNVKFIHEEESHITKGETLK